MPLGSIDRTPPPFFRVGFAPLTKLIFFSALSLLLMFADSRLQFAQPLRAGLSTLMLPVQWLVLQPGHAARAVSSYFENLEQAQHNLAQAQLKALEQAARSQKVEQLQLENQSLRQLIALQSTVANPSQVAEVLFDVADPYNQRLVISKGHVQGIAPGSAVIDAGGVIGQVTRVFPLTSEVTLLTDREQSIPVLNARTGARNVAYGEVSAGLAQIELRFVPASADVQEGDMLTTSGVDGIYPAGLQVARINHIERRSDISFARILATPLAQQKGRHLLVLQPPPDLATTKGRTP